MKLRCFTHFMRTKPYVKYFSFTVRDKTHYTKIWTL